MALTYHRKGDYTVSKPDNSGNRSTDREIRNSCEDISEGVQVTACTRVC